MTPKKLKVCMFVDEKGGTPSEGNGTPQEGYLNMKSWLTMYLADADTLAGVRPFQLPYRNFDVYFVDIGGYPMHVQDEFMLTLGTLVRGRASRLYLFWTGESWEAFCRVNPELVELETCINCCEMGALEKMGEFLLD